MEKLHKILVLMLFFAIALVGAIHWIDFQWSLEAIANSDELKYLFKNDPVFLLTVILIPVILLIGIRKILKNDGHFFDGNFFESSLKTETPNEKKQENEVLMSRPPPAFGKKPSGASENANAFAHYDKDNKPSNTDKPEVSNERPQEESKSEASEVKRPEPEFAPAPAPPKADLGNSSQDAESKDEDQENKVSEAASAATYSADESVPQGGGEDREQKTEKKVDNVEAADEENNDAVQEGQSVPPERSSIFKEKGYAVLGAPEILQEQLTFLAIDDTNILFGIKLDEDHGGEISINEEVNEIGEEDFPYWFGGEKRFPSPVWLLQKVKKEIKSLMDEVMEENDDIGLYGYVIIDDAKISNLSEFKDKWANEGIEIVSLNSDSDLANLKEALPDKKGEEIMEEFKDFVKTMVEYFDQKAKVDYLKKVG